MIEDFFVHTVDVLAPGVTQDATGGPRYPFGTVRENDVACRVEDMSANEALMWAQRGINASHKIFRDYADMTVGDGIRFGTRFFGLLAWQTRRAIGTLDSFMVLLCREIIMQTGVEP